MHGNVPCKCFEIEGESCLSISMDADEPSSFEEAMHSSSSKWLAAMKDEMNSVAKNHV